jgi:hypothetical protein
MAKKVLAINNGERALLVCFCGLLREAIDQIKGPDYYNRREEINKRLTRLIALISRLPNLEYVRNVFDLLYGSSSSNLIGYPHSAAVVAEIIGKPVEQVIKFESSLFLNASNMSEQLISGARKRWLEEHPCSCGAKISETHQMGCEAEECPFCHKLVWKCMCPYKHLNLGRGGRSAKEWKKLGKDYGAQVNQHFIEKNIRPLTAEEKRRWMAVVLRKGSIPYGSERRFQ